MARKPRSMRHIRDILRLKHQNQLSVREIARSCGLPPSTVGDYLQRAEAAGLSWPLPEGLEEPELRRRLLGGNAEVVEPELVRPMPDWEHVHAELRRPHVTLQLLWQEYHQTQPQGYSYSRFCELYRAWANTLEPTLRQVHVPGEKLFVDWAGATVPIHAPATGTVSEASLFVAVLGASNKTYVEAFPNQQLGSWIRAHVRAYAFFGGVPRLTIPDNTKTAVIRASRYEPVLHRTYQEMAQHYRTAILPTRAAKPRDKAKAEVAVQIAQRQILAALRDQRFFSLPPEIPRRRMTALVGTQVLSLPTPRGGSPVAKGARTPRSPHCSLGAGCPQQRHLVYPAQARLQINYAKRRDYVTKHSDRLPKVNGLNSVNIGLPLASTTPPGTACPSVESGRAAVGTWPS